MKFPLDCDLDKELLLILLDSYQKNTDLEIKDHKITQKGNLKNICLSTKKSVTFDLPPIEEQIMDCHKSPMRKYLHPKLLSHLMDPRHLTNNFKYASLLNRLYNMYMSVMFQ